MWSLETSRGEESLKIAPYIVPYTRGRGIDVGCGPAKPFAHFIGIDNGMDYGGQRLDTVDIIHDCEEPLFFADGSLDFVFSSHYLEHVVDYRAVLRDWWRVIKPGGHLVLYLPHADLYPRMGQPGANPDHKRDFLPRDVANALQDIAEETGMYWDCLEDEVRSERDEYSFFLVFRKQLPGET